MRAGAGNKLRLAPAQYEPSPAKPLPLDVLAQDDPLLKSLSAAQSLNDPAAREIAVWAVREEISHECALRQELEASRVRSEQTMKQRVHELGPELRVGSQEALHIAARLWADLGQDCEAVRVLEGHIALHPDDALAHLTLAEILMEAPDPVRDFERALEAAREAKRRHPEPGPALPKIEVAIAQALLLQGKPELALAELPDEPFLRLPMIAMINWTLHRDCALFDSDIAKAIALGDSISPAFIAQAYAWRGDVKEAFKWIDVAIHGNGAGLNYLTRSPFACALRQDAKRWHQLLYRFNRLPGQLARIARLMPSPPGA